MPKYIWQMLIIFQDNTPKTLEQCIKSNKLKKIKCVINMYLGGSANNIEKFYKLKKNINFF